MRRLLLLTALGCAALAPPAWAETRESSEGAVSATFSFETVREGIEWRDLRLTIRRGDATVVDRPVRVRDCGNPYCRPIDVTVRDLDADGEPEVLLDVFTGGAHCCTITELLTWNGTGYRSRFHEWLDAGYTLEDLNRDGRPELRSVDARFRYEFASFAASAFPVQFWQVDGGVFEDVTAGFPELIERDAARWLRIWRGRRGKKLMEPNGSLAAWAADMHLLGKRAVVTRQLRVAVRRKWVTRGFVRDLDRFLKVTGYRR